MVWKHYQVGRGLFSIRLPIPNFKFQFSKSIKPFPQFNLTFEKKYLFPKMPKNHPKMYTKPPNSGHGYKHRDLALLET